MKLIILLVLLFITMNAFSQNVNEDSLFYSTIPSSGELLTKAGTNQYVAQIFITLGAGIAASNIYYFKNNDLFPATITSLLLALYFQYKAADKLIQAGDKMKFEELERKRLK